MSNTNKSDKSGSTSSGRRYFRRSKSGSPKPVADSSSPSKPDEKKSKSGGSSEKPRRSRRKSRSDNQTAKGGSNEERSTGRGRRESNRSLRRRSGSDTKRRRRRRRRDTQEGETVEKNRSSRGPSIIDAIQREYRSPQDVYSYTHIIRPDQRDSYEFRSDHFSNTSRHLEDYTIDLSSILNEAGEITLKQFFQEMPEDVDFETDGSVETREPDQENRPQEKNRAEKDRADDSKHDPQRDNIESSRASTKSRRTERRKDAKRTPKPNVDDDLEEYFADDDKSLEQIYDELEMFTEDMEI